MGNIMHKLKETVSKAAKPGNLLGLVLFGTMLFLLTSDVNVYLTETLTPTAYYTAITLMLCFAMYFRMGRFSTEEKLMLLFLLWVAVTRIFYGFTCFFKEYYVLLVLCLSLAILCILRMLGKKERELLLKALCLAGLIYYTLLAFVAFYAAIGKKILYNPITQKNLVLWFEGRLSIFELNPNRVGQYFMGGMLCSFMLVVKSKNKLLKAIFCFTALVNFLAESLTGCRTVMVAVAVSAAFAAAVFVYVKMLKAKRLRRIVVCAAAFIALIPTVYKGFDLGGVIFAELNKPVVTETETIAVESALLPEEENDAAFAGTRSAESLSDDPLSGRADIYDSIPLLLKKEPLRLLIGSKYDDRLTFTNQYVNNINVDIQVCYDTLHNSFLEILVLCGIPGLLIVLAFTGLIVYKAARCSLTENEQTGIDMRMSVVPMLTCYLCSLPETFLFFATDFQTMLFFVIVGVFLGDYEEMMK